MAGKIGRHRLEICDHAGGSECFEQVLFQCHDRFMTGSDSRAREECPDPSPHTPYIIFDMTPPWVYPPAFLALYPSEFSSSTKKSL